MSDSNEQHLTTRFIVHRSTKVERARERGQPEDYALIFLTPLMPQLEQNPPSDEEGADADARWEAELAATPNDFSFTADQTDSRGYGRVESGIEVLVDKPIAIGTIVDIDIRIIGVRRIERESE